MAIFGPSQSSKLLNTALWSNREQLEGDSPDVFIIQISLIIDLVSYSSWPSPPEEQGSHGYSRLHDHLGPPNGSVGDDPFLWGLPLCRPRLSSFCNHRSGVAYQWSNHKTKDKQVQVIDLRLYFRAGALPGLSTSERCKQDSWLGDFVQYDSRSRRKS